MQEHIVLAPYTLYKIGGPARYFAEVRTREELSRALDFAREKNVPFFVFGGGSNMLISDRGFEGLAIRITGGEARVEGKRVIADAGVMMARVVAACADAGLTGFEWGIGVPGTIGGSVRGNAGCFGGEMSQILEQVQVLEFPIFPPKADPPRADNSQFSTKIKVLKLTSEDCQFSYRDSIFKRHPEWVIVSVILRLGCGDGNAIRHRIAEITRERTKKQDIGTKSCGCIFKNILWDSCLESKDVLCARNPELELFRDSAHIPASFLLDHAGMKGRAMGKVRISQAHANFFINEGGATAEEVRALIANAKDTVQNKYGVVLEEEIQYVGF